MEVIPYFIGVVLFVLLVYWSAANATAAPGEPSFGLFRYRESAAPAEKERKRQSRALQPQHPVLTPPVPRLAAPTGGRPPARPRPSAPRAVQR